MTNSSNSVDLFYFTVNVFIIIAVAKPFSYSCSTPLPLQSCFCHSVSQQSLIIHPGCGGVLASEVSLTELALLTQSGHVETDETNRITWPGSQVLYCLCADSLDRCTDTVCWDSCRPNFICPAADLRICSYIVVCIHVAVCLQSFSFWVYVCLCVLVCVFLCLSVFFCYVKHTQVSLGVVM